MEVYMVLCKHCASTRVVKDGSVARIVELSKYLISCYASDHINLIKITCDLQRKNHLAYRVNAQSLKLLICIDFMIAEDLSDEWYQDNDSHRKCRGQRRYRLYKRLLILLQRCFRKFIAILY
jgi:hypothetical protein